MSATDRLTSDLKAQVLLLEADLRDRVESDANLAGRWKAEHQQALQAERTAAPWVSYRDDRIIQAAVAWVLTSVFVRFCEDNALVQPVWIAGPPSRRQEALDAQLAYFRQNPENTDREWLLQAIKHLKHLPSTAGLVEEHSPLWQVQPSGQAITRLIDFWRSRDDDGALVHDLSAETLSTRFLGDLYQDLSDHAKKTYALLQTPVFVEEFILDQTMEPALAERPLEGFRLIDPTCGSGHFLLGAFDRLVTRWHRHDPALSDREVVHRALDSVYGVDLNPFAVAIARFRLTVAALGHSGLTSLESAPEVPLHVATGDSLLHGRNQREMDLGSYDADSQLGGFTYSIEDLEKLRDILQPGVYDVVVGNPPYIIVKDKTLNQAYRKRYKTCKGTYALTAPFMERFFELARPATHGPSGWIGKITSNSFTKREFGTRVVESFLPEKDLKAVIDSEGVWMSGHNSDGTPTVILIGRNQRPEREYVRVVMGMGKRETRQAGNSGQGPYWRRILEHLETPGFEDEWIAVTEMRRSLLSQHPWSLSGGGASELLTKLDRSNAPLKRRVESIGRTTVVGEDDAWVTTRSRARALGLEDSTRPLVVGGNVRDFRFNDLVQIWWPYTDVFRPAWVPESHPLPRIVLWQVRSILAKRVIFGRSLSERKRPWYDHLECYTSKLRSPSSIAFAEVATHNHFVLDHRARLFKQTAPVIKLREEASKNEHLALLGVLNSSVACFWLKQKCKPKGGAADEFWARTFQFNSSNVQNLPIPPNLPVDRGQSLEVLARSAAEQSPASITAEGAPTAARLDLARKSFEHIRRKMIAEQEELDWEVYGLFDLLKRDYTYDNGDLPEVSLGERAFEIVLARRIARDGADMAWFDRHGSVPITEIPDHWPTAYRDLVQRRIDLIESDRWIGLMERPEHKRRWASVPWEEQRDEALREWLLDRLEDERYWFDSQRRPAPRSVAQLADLAARDSEMIDVLALWERTRDIPLTQSLARLLVAESVPYLAADRLNELGLRKREAWEDVWAMQRREDAGELVGPIPAPPKYKNTDFRKASWWQSRGSLDVPKERFILYPESGRSTDPTPLLGWAGWDHAQQSLALSIIIGQRESEGWEDKQLVPLVAGLGELQPWVEQWHAAVEPTYGISMAEFCRLQLADRQLQVGMTGEDLRAWRPAAANPRRRKRR